MVQRMLGADAVRRRVVTQYLRPVAGERVLDLGCGPADILPLIGAVEYTGVDASPRYVADARQRFGGRGSFHCADVRALPSELGSGFDAVIAIGLLHHLQDEDAAAALAGAAHRLGPGGRLVTVDPARVEGQPLAARWLLGPDRGARIRSPDGYRELVSRRFGSTVAHVHHDLARVPYTHVIVEGRDPILG
jgi:SAM-dependent methyltransferase